MKAIYDRTYVLVKTINATCKVQVTTARNPLEGCAGAFALAIARERASGGEDSLTYLREYLRKNQPGAWKGTGLTREEAERAFKRAWHPRHRVRVLR